jgi:hypothetical protein
MRSTHAAAKLDVGSISVMMPADHGDTQGNTMFEQYLDARYTR